MRAQNARKRNRQGLALHVAAGKDVLLLGAHLHYLTIARGLVPLSNSQRLRFLSLVQCRQQYGRNVRQIAEMIYVDFLQEPSQNRC